VSQLPHAHFPLRRHPDLLVDHRRVRSAAVAEPRGANVESRDRLRWPASFRNRGRDQIGTVADIKSESPAGLRRNSHEATTFVGYGHVPAHRHAEIMRGFNEGRPDFLPAGLDIAALKAFVQSAEA